MKRVYTLLLLLLTMVGASAQQETPYVILVSFDGFRYNYVKNFTPPHFKEFIAAGSQAEAMIPSFPSKTFPNHYSLVTGLVPGHHGLVDNSFYDRGRKQLYSMRDKAKVSDPYYYGGVPLWELAKKNNMKSASFFWVGSELTDEQRRPDYFFPFDDKVDPRTRVAQVIDWLKLPAAERPHMITLYFSFPDHEAHEFGPNAPETKQAVLRADSLLGELMLGVKTTQLPVNVILVSDHGMSELTVAQETYIFLGGLINRKDTSVVAVNGGTQTHLYIRNKQKRDSLYAALKSKEKNFKVLKREEFQPQWKYQTDRTGDLMIMAAEGHYIREGSGEQFSPNMKPGSKFGVHGYDPEQVPDMRGIFYAQGPNIKKGVVLKPFQNIHVYPLIVKILGLPLPKVDGEAKTLEKIYRK